MRRFLTPRLAILSAAHFTIDSYSSFYLPLLPLLVQRLGLNYTLVGTLVALGSMSSSFAQPIFGFVSDRLNRPWFVALGPLVAAIFLASVGGAPSYTILVTLLVLGGFGVSAFHPQTASLAGQTGTDRGKSMSFWVTGGTLGWALGPMFATVSVGLFGLERTWLAALPGVLMAGVLFAWFRRQPPLTHARRARTRLSDLRAIARPLTLLYLAVVARSAVSTGFATFLPLWVHEQGWSVTAGATVTTIYLTCGALGGFAGGWLADRIGARRVVRLSFLLPVPFYVAFFALGGPVGLACLVAGYALLQSSLPVNVVMGQELAPRHASMISSLLMGAAWGVGALLVGPVGALADHSGLTAGLRALSLLLVAGFVCAMLLPDPRLHRSAVSVPDGALD
ncbi:MAG: MFS transporter [Candidatus Eisenbacteria bacterium]|nr:MFS transporter [Candidatus Eisenbacteria bacterium]